MSIKAQLSNYMDEYQRSYGFSGVILAAKGNRICFKKAYNYASIEHKVPNTVDTKFLIASITKQFTAFAVLILCDQGKLNLSDKVSKFLPDFPQGNDILIHHLLTHTSGVFNYTDLPSFFRFSRQSASSEQVISKFASKPLCFTPGKQFSYSNSGYFLLGRIIELVAEETYQQFLKHYVFSPLGMNSTGLWSNTEVVDRLAIGYELLNGNSIRAAYYDSSWPFSAGGLYSTVLDLYKWNRYLMNSNHLLLRRTQGLMFKNHSENYGYGLGLWRQGRKAAFGHGGGISGFASSLMGVKSDKVTVILLTNYSRSIPSGPDISNILLGRNVSVPRKPEERELTEDLREILPGRYTHPILRKIRVAVDGKRVVITYLHPALRVSVAEYWYYIGNKTLHSCEESQQLKLHINKQEQEVHVGPFRKLSRTKW